ncbi:hypothetical protein O3P69_008506 [Scylla paramamosain]|uniref:Uncharacterized protein n=1 Tax=Scylla paramamosain TaxID=85552 RepID=A0AAW0SKU9_SCYPA
MKGGTGKRRKDSPTRSVLEAEESDRNTRVTMWKVLKSDLSRGCACVCAVRGVCEPSDGALTDTWTLALPVTAPGYVVRHFGGGGDDDDYSSEEFPPLMPYEFAYEVKDDATTNYHNRVEFVEDGILQGSYSILSPDGVVRTSVYTDSGKGFEVTLHEVPTDIVVIGSGLPGDPGLKSGGSYNYRSRGSSSSSSSSSFGSFSEASSGRFSSGSSSFKVSLIHWIKP